MNFRINVCISGESMDYFCEVISEVFEFLEGYKYVIDLFSIFDKHENDITTYIRKGVAYND